MKKFLKSSREIIAKVKSNIGGGRKLSLVLGTDIGTEGTKVIVIDKLGHVIHSANATYKYDLPCPGWTEQHPDVWWNAFLFCLKDLWQSGVSPSDIIGIGVAGQMHSPVLLDSQGEIIRKSILWNDERATEICRRISSCYGEERYRQDTCNRLSPGFTASSLLWIREHQPDCYERISKVLMAKDYINFKLTDVCSTDVSDASGTGVFDVKNRLWNEKVMYELDLPLGWFPPAVESPCVIGTVTETASQLTGLVPGTPVIAGAADNAAAAVGTGTTRTGDGLITIGTSGAVIVCLEGIPAQTGVDEPAVPYHLFCHALPNKWYSLGVSLSAGASLRWFKDTFGQRHSYAQLLEYSSQVEPGSEGLIYIPFLTGTRNLKHSAHGAFTGLHLRHNWSHFIRAVIEGVAFSMKACLDVVKDESSYDFHTMVVTGGVLHSPLWTQILCDILEIPLKAPFNAQGAAYGAAILAGMSQGLWDDANKVFSQSIQHVTISPSSASTTYRESYQQYIDYIDKLVR